MRTDRITEEMAKVFYRELCRVVYGNPDKNCGGVMSVELIAEHMHMSTKRATEFCAAMILHGITERQNGMIVV